MCCSVTSQSYNGNQNDCATDVLYVGHSVPMLLYSGLTHRSQRP